ncbi:MAG TPA: hypothetical protein VFU90_16450 [Candidatus Tumulicola sp.]|nr:hypothetical protein [Candidatus Tumulicola sp.]
MDAVQLLKSKIPDFPGYADDLARQRSDELVRSYLGEAIADLQARLSPLDDAPARQIGDLLFRAGFTNQNVYRTYEDAARTRTDYDAMAAADARVVDLADRAPSVDAASLETYLDGAREALDARDNAMDGAA